MELTLIYQGVLKSQQGENREVIKVNKQDIRRIIHSQLRELWKRAPFKPEAKSFCTKIGGFNFLPLVVEGRSEVAEINIQMLRPTPPGFIVGYGGDIDNRIKTLLDSFRMPKHVSELPKDDEPQDAEDPFYCLLEDDKLITKLCVSTGRLLVPAEEDSSVHLTIDVYTKQIEPEWGHMQLTLSRL
jgi:hypothetical protein